MAEKLINLIKKSRSYRRFNTKKALDRELLKSFIDHARVSPSARNQQSLKFRMVYVKEETERVFPLLKWAGYLKEWDGPAVHERPPAYIVILNDSTISENHFCDDGIAMQSILLAATEKGYGGCIIAAVDRDKLRVELSIPDHLKICYVLALGEPAEQVEIEPMKGDNIEYWRDNKGVHHVPKRKIDDIIIS